MRWFLGVIELKPPVVCHSPDRAAYDRTLQFALSSIGERGIYLFLLLLSQSITSDSLEFRSTKTTGKTVYSALHIVGYKVETLFTG